MKLINKIINIFSFTIVSKQEFKKLKNENRNLKNENLKLKDKNEKLSESKHVCPNKCKNSTKNSNHGFNLDSMMPLNEQVEHINNFLKNRISISSNNGKEYTEFTDEKTVKDWAGKLYGKWANKLKTIQEQFLINKPFKFDKRSMLNDFATAIQLYSGSTHQNINSVLRSECDIEDKDMYIRLGDKLIYEILCAPRLNNNIIVYRGVDSSTFENIISNIQKNGDFVEDGFMSTTLLKDILVYGNNDAGAYCDYPYILKIYVDEGEVAVYSPLLCDKDDEHEMLFLHGGTLTIRNKAEIDRKLKKIIIACNYQNKKY
ncbi:hypothetical protein O3801_00935 [Gemella sp. 27098_8_149]|uniref:ADP-ribosyltransferase n=1 Tax=Gemella sp. 27098_8_149 TaxID=3003689 RepID=UPI00352F6534